MNLFEVSQKQCPNCGTNVDIETLNPILDKIRYTYDPLLIKFTKNYNTTENIFQTGCARYLDIGIDNVILLSIINHNRNKPKSLRNIGVYNKNILQKDKYEILKEYMSTLNTNSKTMEDNPDTYFKLFRDDNIFGKNNIAAYIVLHPRTKKQLTFFVVCQLFTEKVFSYDFYYHTINIHLDNLTNFYKDGRYA